MTLIEKILKLSNPEELGYAGIFGFLIQTHIVLGLLTLVTASIVLVMTKGTALHKRVGLVVVIALMANFLLGVPLGTFGRMANGLEANLLTSVGAVYVGVLAFSGFRLAQAGALARGWLDKTFWGLQILTTVVYGYLALLMVMGTGFLGLKAVTYENEQLTLGNNTFPVFEAGAHLVKTTDGQLVGMIASENFVSPLVYGLILGWFAIQDWGRISERRTYSRTEIIHQHLSRVLVAFSGAVVAALLNVDWLSVWLNWTIPAIAALGLAAYFRVYGYKQPAPRRLDPLLLPPFDDGRYPGSGRL